MNQIPKDFAHSAGYFLQLQDAGSGNVASFGKEALQASSPLLSIGRWFRDTQPGTQTAP